MASISPSPSLYFYVRRMGRWMVPLVKDNNPHGTVSLGFDEEYAREDRQENFPTWLLVTKSRRRYMAEILPKRRKTLSNQ